MIPVYDLGIINREGQTQQSKVSPTQWMHCLGLFPNWNSRLLSQGYFPALFKSGCRKIQFGDICTGGLQSMGSLRVRRLSNFTFTFHFHALEKEIATHSSVLAWRISGTGEPGGLPSMGSHRVRHDWSDLAAAAAAVLLLSSIVSISFSF